MSVTQADLDWTKEYCGNIGRWYTGPDPVRYGMTHEDPEEAKAMIDEAWLIWSSFMISYVKVMLVTLAGYKKAIIDGQIARDCSPLEAKGAHCAMQVFWRSDLLRRGGLHKVRHVTLSGLQHRIFEDDEAYRDVFHGVTKRMEAYVDNTLRTRRAFLDGPVVDGDALVADFDVIFCSPMPRLLKRATRKREFRGMSVLEGSTAAPMGVSRSSGRS